ncbi:MAG: glycoside hydrolase family 31 protein [Eubacteriales bacterium]|nr:glycoside hydrolase family 31 protein [Eubacteriales bacterium]
MQYRITFLTERLVRLEYQADGHFVDNASAAVLNRHFGNVKAAQSRQGKFLEYNTKYLQLLYNEEPFSAHGLQIRVKTDASLYTSVWHYGQTFKTLGGTARTLDQTDGEVEIDDGVIAKDGYALLDDSHSAIFVDGKLVPREEEGIDLYFFGYGHDYKGALKDFFALTGKIPMLPRYALGNWWSRYYEYSASEYLSLMDKFQNKNVPLSVAVIDMDWHITKVDPQYGSGWTGYTWNTELFPDPKAFMDNLHNRGMRITLNLHPANGVQPYEKPYEAMRQAMGTEEGKAIDFHCTDPKFMEAYFKYLHHPLEDEGVDFWWIDWQQGTESEAKGIDPLMVLNHSHYEDSKRRGERSLILSRYHGPGSHRYPVGFSGDTRISWKSLQLQPGFTARAANIGYTWWSHDIGGHYHGTYDEELFVRWVQYGVFSPINRLHSSKNDFTSKEPWVCNMYNEAVISKYLRLRHQMLPYLYTAMFRSHSNNEPLCTPLYHQYPDCKESYEYQNQYFFGSELMAIPVITKQNPVLNAAEQTAWLPQGLWFDFFTGKRYQGDGFISLFRDIENIPVLAKAGAIVPLTDELQANQNPSILRVRIFPGANNTYTLYEDDNQNHVQKALYTHFALDYANASFSITQEGDVSIAPANRSYILEFVGFADLQCEGAAISKEGNVQRIACNACQSLQFTNMALAQEDTLQLLFARLAKANIEYALKEFVYNTWRDKPQVQAIHSILAKVEDAALYRYIMEVLQ